MSSRDTRVYREVNTGGHRDLSTGGAVFANVYRQARLLGQTSTISFRVPIQYKIWYLELERGEKDLIKRVIMSMIERLATGSSHVEYAGQPIIINMNINENKVDVRVDARRLEEVLEEIREIAEVLERSSVMYKAGLRNYAKKLKKIASVIEDVKDRFATN